MKKLITATITIIIIITGCSSGISKEDYNTKIEELTNIKNELDEYKSSDKSNAKAYEWAKESFGKDTRTVVDGKDLYVCITTGYTISEKSISVLWTTLLSGISSYENLYNKNPEEFPFDSIRIIVLNETTGLDMLSFQILKDANGTFTKNSSMISVTDFNTLAPYLNSVVNGNDNKPNPSSESETEPQKIYTLKNGILLDANPNGGVDGNTLVIKAKIKSNLTNEMTISQNYTNVADIIRNQDGNTFNCIDYWAVADMNSGNEEKVVSFTLSKDVINQIYNAQITDGQIGDYADDLFIHQSLE